MFHSIFATKSGSSHTKALGQDCYHFIIIHCSATLMSVTALVVAKMESSVGLAWNKMYSFANQ